MVHITLGQPEHGWLPVALTVEAFELALDVSDVPVNPLEELGQALRLVVQGGAGVVCWHLEPSWYQFRFAPGGKEVEFSVWTGPSYHQQDIELLYYKGTFDAVVLPFYRALKQFATRSFTDHDWPALDPEKLQRLTNLVHARKQTPPKDKH